jgi:hypothetical protein
VTGNVTGDLTGDVTGDVTGSVTVGAGKTLNVSAGTLTLADNQISGDKVEGGTINATTINTLTSTTVNTGAFSASGDADFTSDVDISLDSGTAFRVGTTTNPSKSVLTVDTSDGNPKVYVGADLVVNNSITAGDNDDGTSGALLFKGGIQYDTDDITKTAATNTLTASEHIVTADSSSNNVELSLPTAAGAAGQEYILVVTDNTNDVTVKPVSGQVVYDTDGSTLATNASPGLLGGTRAYRIIAISGNWYRV